ncbi:hypothetical protein BHE74_00045374 [Ensete ventricosum]|nr:hypothetical protein BHE74_00045374 [Ensete ventricosum]
MISYVGFTVLQCQVDHTRTRLTILAPDQSYMCQMDALSAFAAGVRRASINIYSRQKSTLFAKQSLGPSPCASPHACNPWRFYLKQRSSALCLGRTRRNEVLLPLFRLVGLRMVEGNLRILESCISGGGERCWIGKLWTPGETEQLTISRSISQTCRNP